VRFGFASEEFEDTKEVIEIRISKKNSQQNGQKKNSQQNGQKKNSQQNGQKKDRQHNGQKKKYNRINNDPQNIHIKLKIE
jgi:hypothetical protein